MIQGPPFWGVPEIVKKLVISMLGLRPPGIEAPFLSF